MDMGGINSHGGYYAYLYISGWGEDFVGFVAHLPETPSRNKACLYKALIKGHYDNGVQQSLVIRPSFTYIAWICFFIGESVNLLRRK